MKDVLRVLQKHGKAQLTPYTHDPIKPARVALCCNLATLGDGLVFSGCGLNGHHQSDCVVADDCTLGWGIAEPC